ncbi:hypothetical protein PAECIP111891_01062 [Paenibacillus allorhizoplanae]|uniref:Uncharacterized protein n=1 Tax=Paenibacillus allorhizoplanae TaxID=2905648 RepID=A0ABN8G2G2_9BACL|nr:hypothetical protein [Paenibacillus allorhizoplanae]CAH1197097.1 hypothetical protein PAECIP111891_01062 [Paenibacillus allorhizoplanae]
MKLKTKIIAITAICLVAASVFSISVLAAKDVASLKALVQTAKDKETVEHNKLDSMPDQTREDKEARNLQGIKVKSLGNETRRLELEADPDDTKNFARQLEESIGTLTLCVIGFKADAVRYNDDKYLKQAEEVQKIIEKYKKGKEEYQKNEKSVHQLRKELDIPVN